MNFEFPLKELPAVMRGPRMERRRVLVGGSACWGSIVEEGAQQGQLRLDDGRVVDLATVQHLPPVSPSKIIAVHISYRSRSAVRDVGKALGMGYITFGAWAGTGILNSAQVAGAALAFQPEAQPRLKYSHPILKENCSPEKVDYLLGVLKKRFRWIPRHKSRDGAQVRLPKPRNPVQLAQSVSLLQRSPSNP